MNAKEMFEELGYECQEDDKYINWIQKNDYYTFEIAFDYNTECIEFYCYKDTYDDKYDVSLTTKELQAINKQVEELGWLDNDN